MRNTVLLAAGCAALLLAATAPARAQMGGGPGSGPGMMGQGNMGQGYMGQGYMGQGYMGQDGGPGQGRRGRGMMSGCGPMTFGQDGAVSAFVDGRVAFLKAELGITDAQAKVWDAFAEALKSNFINMQGLRQAMQATFTAETPVDRLDSRISVMESRVAALKEMKKPLADLYGALSDTQKEQADALLTSMGCMM